MGLGALPEYPWDRLAPYRATAAERAAAAGVDVVDLTVGSPVDPTPQRIRDALAEATDAHGYPTSAGSAAARDAVAEWFARDRGVPGLTRDEVLLTVGSKEFVATAAFFLGLGEQDAVVQPEVAYPTYEMGAVFAGAQLVRADDPAHWPDNTKLVWLNSPGNPNGRVLDAGQLREAVARARELGAVIINDECYAELGWDAWAERRIPSILDPAVVGVDRTGVLACSSLSKRSNLAGYRAAYVAGDAAMLARLLVGRKHAGLMVPTPVQHALVAALGDEADAREQSLRYRHRREALRPAVEAAGLRIDDSEAGLYLWATRGEDCWRTVEWFAQLGIVIGPGEFYGDAGRQHVRLTLTASDEAIAEAVRRLAHSSL
ncbi:succinyldiaminopimelate transaminase [Gulosibacter sediminis]|uniref:succinyldiaminopimelate transaminase n=1 Tax=Gulosibacter sediminis TaxID=1729695 RepID=UPI0024AE67A6|nr:succinyldiaminopimelate transaminase [Gulosibacter sediminis]